MCLKRSPIILEAWSRVMWNLCMLNAIMNPAIKVWVGPREFVGFHPSILVSLVMWLGAILGNIIYYLNGSVIGAWIPTGALWWSGKGDLIMLSHLFQQDEDSRMTNFHWVANKYHIYICIRIGVYIYKATIHVLNVLLSHPSLGWLYVFSSFSPPHPPRPPPPPPPQWLLLLTSKPFQLNLRYLGQRKYRSRKMYWMTVL